MIEDEYSEAKLDRAGDRDFFSYNHQQAMGLFKRIKTWLQEEHSTLEIITRDVEARLRFMRNQGHKAQTRKHWLYAFNLIADIAVRLEMMHENPAKSATDPKDKNTISVPSIPKHVKRTIVPQHIVQAMLDWSPTIDEEGFVCDEKNHERKETRKPHIFSLIEIDKLKKLPDNLSHPDVMSILNVSEATVKRYTSKGILPPPKMGKTQAEWYIKRDDLLQRVVEA